MGKRRRIEQQDSSGGGKAAHRKERNEMTLNDLLMVIEDPRQEIKVVGSGSRRKVFAGEACELIDRVDLEDYNVVSLQVLADGSLRTLVI